MAQAGYTPIQLYVSTSAGVAPSAGNLANGELAINITDGKLFYKDNGGVVQVLATKGAGTIGGSTTQVQYNNAGALAGSANLTFDGTTLTLGANPVLSGGTANGVPYLNASKVLTSGSALTFDGTNLGVGIAVPLVRLHSATSGNTAIIAETTGGATSYFNLRNTGGQAYIAANNNDLVFATTSSATEGARLTSGGFVVGSSTAIAKLTVNGGTTIANLGDWNSKANSAFTLANPAVRFGIGYDSSDQVLLQAFDSSNNPRLLCLQGYGGNVGIGSNAVPSVGSTVVLGVGGANGGTLAVLQSGSIVYRTSASTSGVDFYNPNASPMQWYTSGANRLVLDANGNLNLISGNIYTTTTSGIFFTGTVGNFNNGIYATAGNNVAISANGTERLRVDTSGNLLVGTTSAALSTNTFFKTSGAGQPVLYLFKNSGSSSTDQAFCVANGLAGGTVSFQVLANGNAQNTNNSYGAISDVKLKYILGAAPSYWDKFKQYEFVNYTLKADEFKTKLLGLVAQQVEQISPGLIEELPDFDKTGKNLGTTTKGVKYSVVTLQAEVVLQEAQRRIESLEAIIEQLKADVAALKGA